jgi:hypothetical protein
MTKQLSALFWAAVFIILGLHFSGIWSIDGLFDLNAKDVQIQLEKYTKNGLSINQFKNSFGGADNKTTIEKTSLAKTYENTLVAWTGKVDDVEGIRKFYRIRMESDYTPENDLERALSNGIRFILGSQSYKHINSVCGWIYIYPRNTEESQILRNLKRGDGFRYEGIIKDIDSKGCITVKPALLSRDRSEVVDKGFNSDYINKQIDGANKIIEDVRTGIKNGVIEGLKDSDAKKVEVDALINKSIGSDFELTNHGNGRHTCIGKITKDETMGILVCDTSPDDAGKIMGACSINNVCQVKGRIRGHGVFEWYEVETARSLQ